MFSLDDSMRYWLFTEPTDMRKSFHMLSGIVNNQMSADLRNGDVFIFVNKNRNRIKLLRKEPGGLVIYAMMLDYGRLRLPSVEQGAISRALEWRDLAGMIRHVIEDPNYRLRCLRSGSVLVCVAVSSYLVVRNRGTG